MMTELLCLFPGALLLLALAALLTNLAKHWLNLADHLRELLKQAGLDLIQIYSSANQAEIDKDTQRAKLEYSQELAQMRLTAHRQKLLGEVKR